MPVRALGHITRRLLILAAGVLAVGLVLFVALTRTRAGRDFVRAQLEAAFRAHLGGQLQIERLDGDLVRGLYATRVRLFAPDGRLLLDVDSVALRPAWRMLLSRTLAFRRVELFRPRLFLHYENGRWNFAQWRDTSAAPSDARWSLAITDLHLHNGSVETDRTGPPPEPVRRGQLFDFTQTRLDSLTLQATLEYHPDRLLLDLLQLDAHLSRPDQRLRHLSGQLFYQEGRWHLPRLELALGNTLLALSGQFIPRTPFAESALQLELETGTFDFAELRRLLPGLPLHRPVTMAGRLHGTINGLVLERLELASTAGRLRLEGTLLGLPDSLDFDLLATGTGLQTAGLARLWPTHPLPASLQTPTPLTLRAEARGLMHLASVPTLRRLEGSVRLRGLPGTLEGPFRLVRKAPGDAPAYEAHLRLRNVQPARLWKDGPPSILLNGLAEMHGQGPRQFDLHLRLDPRPFGGGTNDSLLFTLQRSGSRFWATFSLPQQDGSLTATAFYRSDPDSARFRVQAVARRFDLGPYLHPDTLQTHIDATFSLEGAGTTWPELTATAHLQLDASYARRADRSWRLAPASVHLTLTPTDPLQHRLRITGDLLEAELHGHLTPDRLVPLVRYWQQAFAAAIHRQTEKPFYRPPRSFERPLPALRPQLAVLQGRLQVRRLDWLQPLAGLPSFRTDLTATLWTRAGADTLQLALEWQADSLRVGALHQEDVHGRLQLATGRQIDRSLVGLFEWQSARLQQLRQIRLVGYFLPEGAQLSLSSRPDTTGETLRLTATLDLLDRFNRLTLQEFYWQVRDYRWQLTQPAHIDLYADAAVLHSLLLRNRPAADTVAGEIELKGMLSAQVTDTAYVTLRSIALEELTRALGRARRLSGQLEGRLSLVGAFGTPQLAGFLHVDRLHYDRHPLGTLRLVSHYVPGSPQIALDARLDPDTTIDAANRLHLFGTVRLPSSDDAGQLDLRLETTHADAFFFTYIFPDLIANVQGYFAGRGRITGTFRRPIFNAAMQLHAGAFDIPRFNLHYRIEGPVSVDEAGFLLEAVRLQDPTGGQARVDGRIFFNEYRFFSFDLTARLDGLQVMNVTYSRDLPFYGKIWGRGTLSLGGPLYGALLQTADAEVLPKSEIYIPLAESGTEADEAFIIFADSTGRIPERPTRRPNLLARRPPGERSFLDGLDLDLNLLAPQGTTVRLVIDPLLGDVINARGSGRLQIIRQEGTFQAFGQLDVTEGDYLFTAGEIFVRRFLIEGGTITWDGDPINARLDLQAAYRTRASRAGLPGTLGQGTGLIPLVVQMHITGRVEAPQVSLRLAIDRSINEPLAGYEGLEALLNQPERAAEYATSVLLTNSFLLTTERTTPETLTSSGNQLAFNSLSQLIASQLNRYLSQVLPNVDLLLGVQGEGTQRLDVTYGIALRLLNERLIIRGQGVYRGESTAEGQQNLLGEFVVEIRLTPSVSVQVFYRREDDVLNDYTLTSVTGAGLSYQTEFPTWRRLLDRLFGWLIPDRTPPETPPLTRAGNNSEQADVEQHR